MSAPVEFRWAAYRRGPNDPWRLAWLEKSMAGVLETASGMDKSYLLGLVMAWCAEHPDGAGRIKAALADEKRRLGMPDLPSFEGCCREELELKAESYGGSLPGGWREALDAAFPEGGLAFPGREGGPE